MSGIVFFKTKNLEVIHHFYHVTLGMEIWLKQVNGYIYKKGNLLLGFIQADQVEKNGIITIFNQNKEVIDKAYESYKELVIQPLQTNEKYNIYHFYIRDPEGRKVEFQTFLHPLPSFSTADEALMKRRSIREFKEEQVDPQVLKKIFQLCKYSPTASNGQSFSYLVIQDKAELEWLANTRGKSGNPLLNAPMAVLVISDHTKTKRLSQDATIAGTYFMLAAYSQHVGTCWITDMDKDEIKERYHIPLKHHISCAIATGYPNEVKKLPVRRDINEFVKYGKFQDY